MKREYQLTQRDAQADDGIMGDQVGDAGTAGPGRDPADRQERSPVEDSGSPR